MSLKQLIERAKTKEIHITHYAADASNLLQMKKMFASIWPSSPPLRGIFHLAGVVRNDLMINLSDDDLQQVLSAKMESALILHQLTKDMSLDLFVLFSSASSILGSRRQTNYAAANGFLDGLAQLRRHQGLAALSINWGVFHTLGMAATTTQALEKRGFISMDKENMDILDGLLANDLTQIMVCPMHWELYFKNMPKDQMFAEENERPLLSNKSFLSVLRQQSPQARQTTLSQMLCEIACQVLGFDNVEQVGRHTNLFAMGMDSLMSLELRSRVHDRLQCPSLNLPIEYFINDPRIDKITSNLEKELNKIFANAQDVTSPDNIQAGAVTLSDTQYAFWLVDKMGGNFNCPKQVQLHGPLNREYLSKAFAFTVNKNGAFWLSFPKDIPIQMLRRQGQFTLMYEDFSGNYDQAVMNEIFYKNTMQPIPLTEQPLIKVYLYKLEEDLHELHIIIPHIILDESSYRLLFAQVKRHYETLLLGKSLIPEQEQYGYLDYVRQNNRHYETDIKNKIDFWQVYNSGFQKLSFGISNHLPDATKQTQHLYNYPMDEQLVEKFKEWHRERNMNVSTGLIAAFHIRCAPWKAESRGA